MKTFKPTTIGLGMTLVLLGACGGGSGSGPDSLIDSEDLAAVNSSSQSSSSSSEPQEQPTGEWSLVWSDDFEGDAIDSDNWSHEVNCAGGGNNELQCYTAREENSFVEDGQLHIVAREESFSGPAVFDDDPAYDPDDTSVTQDYTSARLRTKNKADWRYGRIEVTAKMPQGQGVWPAIWMMPTESVYGQWPLSGEIDIFEAVNINAAGGNEVHGTLHYGRPWPNNESSGTSYTPEQPIWEEFHTYAVEWEEGEIRWYVDDVHYATQTDDGWFTFAWQGQDEGFQVGEGAAPFDEAFHLILNVAVGGDWPGAPDENTSFPQEMVVDHVRVYECDADPDTGRGCATRGDDAEAVEGTGGSLQENTLYEDGPATLNFDVFDTQVSNTLEPGQWEETSGNIVANAGLDTNGSTVWDVQFNGLSNIFLLSGDMSDTDYVEDGFSFSGSEETSGISFDLRVIDASEDATLSVKLDSGWPNVSAREIDLPGDDEWQNVSVRFSDLEANPDEDGAVIYNDLTAPFVLELSSGTAHVQLNNIRTRCFGESCGLGPKLDGTAPEGTDAVELLSGGELSADWEGLDVGTYTQDGQTIATDTIDDEQRGDVLQVVYGSADGFGTMFLEGEPQDLSAYAAGNLVFDLKVVRVGGNSAGFLVKADCVYPCSSNELPVELPEDEQWHTITVPVPELTDGAGFEIDTVSAPFSLWPVNGEQSEVVFRLDNIRWELSD